MTKELYFIQCTCKKDCKYPNIEFHKGDVYYFNNKARANAMYLWKRSALTNTEMDQLFPNRGQYRGIGDWSYVPFTIQKQHAKRWQIKRYPEQIANIINVIGEFEAKIITIKVTYEEDII